MNSCGFSVGVVGMGNVGATLAYSIVLSGLAEKLVLWNRSSERVKAERQDLEDSLTYLAPMDIIAAESYQDLAGLDVIVITAGVPQKPGESRLDLTRNNKKCFDELIPAINKVNDTAVLIVISNPVDVLTAYIYQLIKPRFGRVFGSGTSLDTARYRLHLGHALKVNPHSIHAYILGEHGEHSFPVISSATVGGEPLTSFPEMTVDRAKEIATFVKQEAQLIIKGKGATYYGIAATVMQLLKSIAGNDRTVFPVSVPLSSYLGLDMISLSLPCVIGRNGVEEVLTLSLDEVEQNALQQAAEAMQPYVKS